MIHPTAIVDPSAEVDASAEVGAYSIIGAEVVLGAEVWIGPHVVVQGPTAIGEGTRIFQFASIGEQPQDKKYRGEPTRLEIGRRNTIREYVTINRGTLQDEGCTRLGDDNWIMAYVHIAHDCRIGNDVIMANNASLAGHVQIDDHAILGGFSLVHQFCRVGRHSFLQFGAGLNRDVPPYVVAAGLPGEPRGINAEGLRRHGFSAAEIQAVKRAYRLLYRQGLRLEDALTQLQTLAEEEPVVAPLAAFIGSSRRGLIR
ncbi:MAG: acyl-ACP--UDP-N-acetylglucosamine O-acyltransferase [Pseudomonadota bacterium]|nr:acyl-ACP--UDP-N-acetylglucosamine O-acyltransferase [Pseudomonadota bacterium]